MRKLVLRQHCGHLLGHPVPHFTQMSPSSLSSSVSFSPAPVMKAPGRKDLAQEINKVA